MTSSRLSANRDEATALVKHPAKFSSPILPVVVGYLRPVLTPGARIIDPMAGVGTLARYAQDNNLPGKWFSTDLEREWVSQAPRPWGVWDARHLVVPDGWFSAWASSCTYGNRMADHHNAQEKCRVCAGAGKFEVVGPLCPSPDTEHCEKCGGTGRRNHIRHTYTHYLGHRLSAGNTGAMPWGDAYRSTHKEIYVEAWRIVRSGGLLVLNASDFFKTLKRDSEPVRQHVSAWHVATLEALGFLLAGETRVETRRQMHGANRGTRMSYESVYCFSKPHCADSNPINPTEKEIAAC